MISRTGTALAVGLAASMVIQAAAQAPRPSAKRIETYRSAQVDNHGNLRIVMSDGRTVTVPKQPPQAGDSAPNQTRFDTPVVSPDRHVVGAQAMFTNCCTSYDIPLQLVIYSQGRTHRFERGLAIFDWHFADGGRRVVFSQQTVHFACSVTWELVDVTTERVLAKADVPEACGQDPDPKPVVVPKWVTGPDSGFN